MKERRGGGRARLTVPPLLLVLCAASACAATPAAEELATPLLARGNEPPWTLRVEGGRLALERGYGSEASIVVPRERHERVADGTRLAGEDGGNGLVATVRDLLCHDDMSGMPHPLTVEVVVDDVETLYGCGGEPAALLRRDAPTSRVEPDTAADESAAPSGWLVESVDGVPPADDGAPATLRFGADGRLSGTTACNRYDGRWTLDGEALGIGRLGTTRRRCPTPAMREEARLLDALERVRRFDVDARGRLVLVTDAGGAVVARPGP